MYCNSTWVISGVALGTYQTCPGKRQWYPLRDLTERWPSDPTREVPAALNREVEIGEFVRRHETLNLRSVPNRAALTSRRVHW